jgi:hypothetical protein
MLGSLAQAQDAGALLDLLERRRPKDRRPGPIRSHPYLGCMTNCDLIKDDARSQDEPALSPSGSFALSYLTRFPLGNCERWAARIKEEQS